MTYIIAEIGQNHNGSVDTARDLVDLVARPVVDYWDGAVLPGVNAVKFTIRDLAAEMTPAEWSKPYKSPHSYGATYGEHREALELAPDELADIAGYVAGCGVDLVLTVCGARKIPLAVSLGPEYLKVASRDLTNGPLLQAIAETSIPIILSTGMHGLSMVRWAVSEVERCGGNIGGILHCISEYPSKYENVNLNALDTLRDAFPEYLVGYSDHTIGLAIAPAAVALGAEIIEKHCTLDRAGKGSDHAGSMDGEGLWRVTRDIRNVERAMGSANKLALPASDEARRKLERSICAGHDLAAGTIIQESDLVLLSPGTGVAWPHRHLIVGQAAARPISAGCIIEPADIDDKPVGSVSF